MNKIICGDCIEVLPKLPPAKMIFADPPDNLGMKYNGYNDRQGPHRYRCWLKQIMAFGIEHSEIFWLSYSHKYQGVVLGWLEGMKDIKSRQLIWRFTFGQHNSRDCGSGYRPLLRVMHPGAVLYPEAIREPSARQTKYHDKRANPAGRVPDDVWEFPRVCGTFKEKRKWHPNQHPEALIERIVKFSCRPGDTAYDMFAGTGTTNRVCHRLGISCTGIEISRAYCRRIAKEGCAKLEKKK